MDSEDSVPEPVAQVAAPDGERRAVSSSSSQSSSSSSEDEEGFASPPPNKRSKRRRFKQVGTCSDPRMDTIINQVTYLTNCVAQMPQIFTAINNTNFNNIKENVGSHLNSVNSMNTNDQFLNKPQVISKATNNNNMSLGELKISYDESKIVPVADPDKLAELNSLQQFNSQAWKGIRYKKDLQTLIATPGFIGLKLNEELCHLNKGTDYLASTEQLLAGLSNAVLENRQLLKNGLQEVVNWAASSDTELSASTLCDKLSEKFGPASPSYKNMETCMQVICGKRAECIEVRRDRILKEVNNVNLKLALQNIPPSAEYLFNREALIPLVDSLGGSQVWLNMPSYLKDKKKVNNTNQVNNKSFKPSYKTNFNKKTKFNSDKKSRNNNYKKHSFRRTGTQDTSNVKDK